MPWLVQYYDHQFRNVMIKARFVIYVYATIRYGQYNVANASHDSDLEVIRGQ